MAELSPATNSRKSVGIGRIFGWLLIAANVASPAQSASGEELALNGAEVLKFLVGKTLRSIENGKSANRRYFLSETVEYYCGGWNTSQVPLKNRARVAEAAGCDLLLLSIKDGRLCESNQYQQCAERPFSLVFTPRFRSASSTDGQILGRVRLNPSPSDLSEKEFDLIKGNDTGFPTFDLAPQPQLLQPDVGQATMEARYRTQDCVRSLTDAEVISRVIGNTVVRLNSKGKPDGRSGEFFSPDGRVVVIRIPTNVESANLQHPSAEAAGTIFINRWRIEDRKLCRTENDDPTKYVCTPSVCIERPEASDNSPRYSVGNSGLGPHAFIAKGNPLGIAFGPPKPR